MFTYIPMMFNRNAHVSLFQEYEIEFLSVRNMKRWNEGKNIVVKMLWKWHGLKVKVLKKCYFVQNFFNLCYVQVWIEVSPNEILFLWNILMFEWFLKMWCVILVQKIPITWFYPSRGDLVISYNLQFTLVHM